MSTRTLSAILSLSALLAGTAVACTPTSPSAGKEVDSLGASQRSYVVISRDRRKCAYPMCSGYFVRDVNRKNPKQVYVSALDFSGSDLDEAAAEQVRGAADGEVVLYGKLGDLADWEDPAMKSFQVSAAWQGMPGEVVDATDVFYATAAIEPALECFVAPCPALTVTPLHKKSQQQIERVDLEGLAEPLLDRNWLTDRVAHRGALVAGALVDGEIFQGGPETILAATQVFLRLPEEQGQCPQSRPGCIDGESAIYTRDENRCVVLSGCVEPGACAQYVPTCGEGYSLVSWTGGQFACTVYGCDPTFVVPPEEAPAEDPPADDAPSDVAADSARD